MRLFLSETFFDAVFKLPKKTQDKVVTFQKKFRENPASPGIHLEPIAQFKNSTMRTARIDDNYRVIIGVLGGNTYSLLYVADHEEAYRWGMSKRFVWNEHTQACQLISIEEKEDDYTSSSQPVIENTFFTGVPEEKLLKIGIPQDAIGRVMSIKSLDDLDALEPILPIDAYENIFNIMDGTNIDDVISNIEEGQAHENEDKLLSDNNKRRFIEITDDDELQRIIDQGMDKWQIFLHPSQRKLVDAEYKGTMKVSGGAGTGKTIAAIHRLKYLCQKADAKVLFTTYTKTLRVNLADSIKKLGVPSNKYTLNNIDRVLLDVAQAYKIKDGYNVLDYSGDEESLKLWREVLETEITEFNEQFLYDEYIDVIVYYGNNDVKEYMMQPRVGRNKALNRKQRIEIWKLVEKYVALKQERKVVDRLELFNETTNYLNENNIHPYTNVIADEFQDFSNPELKFLRALVAEGENDLFLVGDPIQRIYTGRKMNFGAAGINVRGIRSKKLKINYRTTEPIKRVAVGVIKGVDYDDLDGGKESTKGYVSLIHDGIAPQYKIVSDANSEVEQVIEWLNECIDNGIKPSEICIAAPSMQLLKGVQTRLHRDGKEYRVLKGDQKQGSTNGVDLCTFHSLKGLEYRVIILTDVNERNLPSKATEGYPFSGMDNVAKKEYLSAKRSLLYVAITRARQLVYMVGFGEPTDLLKHEI
ncbi:UvrD/REP helicase N-terminal domain-containing protein [Prevotella sp. khp1]|uniref:UvrD-helicase domain-containing protein n=1 Tax=Prevotellaceae TaxID=171552 RepID=UPI0008840DB1|nr:MULTISPECIES: UvrD-helicase domain-containing protein [Prevotellaceae]QVJ81234.1 DEAD/DEAH box helicase [Xylanibacter ruminicola]SDQ05434.1 UvrD/REP helicase N-terminal domain-containing protein [Prevotella sp. khp1]